jgi:hypothetical protein
MRQQLNPNFCQKNTNHNIKIYYLKISFNNILPPTQVYIYQVVCFLQVYRLQFLREKWKNKIKFNRVTWFQHTKLRALKFHINFMSYNLQEIALNI